jgi:hypothetical protein
MDFLVPGVLGGLVASLLLRWFLARQSDVPLTDPVTREHLLRYGAGVKAFQTVLSVGVVVLMLDVTVSGRWATPLDAQLAWVLVPLVVAAGVWVVMEALRTEIRITSEGIAKRPAIGPLRKLRWTDITTVRFSPWSYAIVFTGADGKRIRAGALLNGLGALEAAARQHLEPRIYEEARRAFQITSKGRDGAA